MQIFVRAEGLREYLSNQKKAGKTIGFVPTMGALHEGHLSLVKTSRTKTRVTVVSIFINPTQFNNKEDFSHYPVHTEKDLELLQSVGCDAVFIPGIDEIYPHGTENLLTYDLGYLETIMEGQFRPGHFQGVCQVVERLLKTVEPDMLFLGQKDLQQCKVIERLLDITGMNQRIDLVICDTLREKDGLAMSSRNQRLSGDDRKRAVAIFQALTDLKNSYGRIDFHEAKERFKTKIEEAGLKLEYIELVNTQTLELLQDWPNHSINNRSHSQSVTACVAAYSGKVRLIDNMILHSD